MQCPSFCNSPFFNVPVPVSWLSEFSSRNTIKWTGDSAQPSWVKNHSQYWKLNINISFGQRVDTKCFPSPRKIMIALIREMLHAYGTVNRQYYVSQWPCVLWRLPSRPDTSIDKVVPFKFVPYQPFSIHWNLTACYNWYETVLFRLQYHLQCA